MLEFVFIVELQATVMLPLLSRDAFVRHGNYKRLMSLLLHGCCSRVFLLVAETKDRLNYSVLEPDAYRGGLRRRSRLERDASMTFRQFSGLDIKLREFKLTRNFTDVMRCYVV